MINLEDYETSDDDDKADLKRDDRFARQRERFLINQAGLDPRDPDRIDNDEEER